MKKLQELLEHNYEDARKCGEIILCAGSELRESKFDGLLALVKE